MAHIYNFLDFSWKSNRLMCGNRFSGVQIVPDGKWRSMWRVEYPAGHLSDMVNKTRAMDAARQMALVHWNTDRRAQEGSGEII